MTTICAALCRRQWLDCAHGNSGAAAMLAEAAAEEAAAAAALGVRRVGAVEDLRCLEEDLDSNVERRLAASSRSVMTPTRPCRDGLVGVDLYQLLPAFHSYSGITLGRQHLKRDPFRACCTCTMTRLRMSLTAEGVPESRRPS